MKYVYMFAFLFLALNAQAADLPVDESIYRWGEFSRPSKLINSNDSHWDFNRVDMRVRIKGTIDLVVLKLSIVPETEFYWERSAKK